MTSIRCPGVRSEDGRARGGELGHRLDAQRQYGFFVGSLDEVALYDKAVSAERIAAHHTAGAGT
jgi:hypothetical protein